MLGIGLGGFVDGIVLHQILQWHHLVTNAGFPPDTVRNLQINTLWDGIFHAGTWAATALGLGLLWRATRQGAARVPGRVLLGGMAAGWGAFNLVEGIVNHHVLQIHHVRSGPNELAWDLAFLALGAVLAGVGWWLARPGQSERQERADIPADSAA